MEQFLEFITTLVIYFYIQYSFKNFNIIQRMNYIINK